MNRDKNGLTALNRLVNKICWWRSKYEPLYGFSDYHKRKDLLLFSLIRSNDGWILWFKRRRLLLFYRDIFIK